MSSSDAKSKDTKSTSTKSNGTEPNHPKHKDAVWDKKTSGKGVEYQVGYPPPPDPITGSIAVDWPEGTSGNTTDDVYKATGIRSYSVQDVIGWIYQWEIDFNTENEWDYVFTDQSGDTYSCSCDRTGGHYIDYNSRLPNITQVSWSYTPPY